MFHRCCTGFDYNHLHLKTRKRLIAPDKSSNIFFIISHFCHEPSPYQYAYGVKDEYTGTNLEAAESFDEKVVYGHYSVLLPDGRLQNVKYTADHYT